VVPVESKDAPNKKWKGGEAEQNVVPVESKDAPN
jgi:hypothetical protein